MLKSILLESFWTKRAALQLTKALGELKPDVVWVIPHDWSIPPLAIALVGKWRCYHVTVQDYVDVRDNPQRFGHSRCERMARMGDELYAAAATRDATSHPMIADLRARTGADAAQMLHAGLEAADFDFLGKKSSRSGGAIRICYAGTILVEDSFHLFVSALDSIRNALRQPAELHFFGAHSYAQRSWFRRDWMVEHGNLRNHELLAKLRECDWAFAPMSLTEDDPRYNRFSFPTKFITYLAAGLPVITLGHPESSVMKMASRYEVGVATSAADSETLATQLKGALDATDSRDYYRAEILRCARTEFDATRMRHALYACFSECAGIGASY